MRYDAVIFDLDGTLLNTLDDLAAAVNAALASCGYPPRTLDEVRAFVGNGVAKLIGRAVPAGTAPEEEERCLDRFRAHYLVHMRDQTAPYPGILSLLDALQQAGIAVAVVSNKFDAAVKELCRDYSAPAYRWRWANPPPCGKSPPPTPSLPRCARWISRPTARSMWGTPMWISRPPAMPAPPVSRSPGVSGTVRSCAPTARPASPIRLRPWPPSSLRHDPIKRSSPTAFL